MGHQNFYRCTKKGYYRYIDISASDGTFPLCIALRKCCIAPAGNNLEGTFLSLFKKKRSQFTNNIKLGRYK